MPFSNNILDWNRFFLSSILKISHSNALQHPYCSHFMTQKPHEHTNVGRMASQLHSGAIRAPSGYPIIMLFMLWKVCLGVYSHCHSLLMLKILFSPPGSVIRRHVQFCGQRNWLCKLLPDSKYTSGDCGIREKTRRHPAGPSPTLSGLSAVSSSW